MSLKYEPASEPQHISVKWLFLNAVVWFGKDYTAMERAVRAVRMLQVCQIYTYIYI